MSKALAIAKPKRQPDPRHAQVRELLNLLWREERKQAPALPEELPWGPAEAGALGALLRENPGMTTDQIRYMLRNRLLSEDHPPGERCFVWLKHLTRYAAGPLNKYRQLKEGGSDGKPNRADDHREQLASSTAAALDRIRRAAGR